MASPVRSSVRQIAVCSLLASAIVVSAPIASAAPPEDSPTQAEARTAYEAGETAYRLGRFDEAAREFEKAYELSGLPGFLYNIGLAHLRWYDIDPDLAHLRKAKVVFENYQIELQKDPDLGDPEEAKTVLATIEKKIAAHQDRPDPVDDPPPPKIDDTPRDPGPDPGKKLRLAGTVTLGVGGVLVLGGVVGGVVLALRSKEFNEELNNTYDELDATGCNGATPPAECTDLEARLEVARRNGRKANTLAVGVGVGLGGAGLIAIVAGAVILARGSKLTKKWEAAGGGTVGVSPMWMLGGGGLGVHGRF